MFGSPCQVLLRWVWHLSIFLTPSYNPIYVNWFLLLFCSHMSSRTAFPSMHSSIHRLPTYDSTYHFYRSVLTFYSVLKGVFFLFPLMRLLTGRITLAFSLEYKLKSRNWLNMIGQTSAVEISAMSVELRPDQMVVTRNKGHGKNSSFSTPLYSSLPSLAA